MPRRGGVVARLWFLTRRGAVAPRWRLETIQNPLLAYLPVSVAAPTRGTEALLGVWALRGPVAMGDRGLGCGRVEIREEDGLMRLQMVVKWERDLIFGAAGHWLQHNHWYSRPSRTLTVHCGTKRNCLRMFISLALHGHLLTFDVMPRDTMVRQLEKGDNSPRQNLRNSNCQNYRREKR